MFGKRIHRSHFGSSHFCSSYVSLICLSLSCIVTMASRSPISIVHGHTKIFVNDVASIGLVLKSLDDRTVAAGVDDFRYRISDVVMHINDLLADAAARHKPNFRDMIYTNRGKLSSKLRKQLMVLNTVYSFSKHFSSAYAENIISTVKAELGDVYASGSPPSSASASIQSVENASTASSSEGAGALVCSASPPICHYIGDLTATTASQTDTNDSNDDHDLRDDNQHSNDCGLRSDRVDFAICHVISDNNANRRSDDKNHGNTPTSDNAADGESNPVGNHYLTRDSCGVLVSPCAAAEGSDAHNIVLSAGHILTCIESSLHQLQADVLAKHSGICRRMDALADQVQRHTDSKQQKKHIYIYLYIWQRPINS